MKDSSDRVLHKGSAGLLMGHVFKKVRHGCLHAQWIRLDEPT